MKKKKSIKKRPLVKEKDSQAAEAEEKQAELLTQLPAEITDQWPRGNPLLSLSILNQMISVRSCSVSSFAFSIDRCCLFSAVQMLEADYYSAPPIPQWTAATRTDKAPIIVFRCD